MNRNECENIIKHNLAVILEAYRMYNPNGDNLNLCVSIGHNSVSAFNAYWDACDGDPRGKDFDTPIDLYAKV